MTRTASLPGPGLRGHRRGDHVGRAACGVPAPQPRLQTRGTPMETLLSVRHGRVSQQTTGNVVFIFDGHEVGRVRMRGLTLWLRIPQRPLACPMVRFVLSCAVLSTCLLMQQ
jgi:hypothetical protein